MRHLLIVLMFVLCPSLSVNAQQWEISPDAEYHKSVMLITCDEICMGSGTVIKYIKDDGYKYVAWLLTASHIMCGNESTFTATTNDGRVFSGGKVIKKFNYREMEDRSFDIGIIEISIDDDIPIMECSSEIPKIGETVELCGYGTGWKHWNAIFGGQSLADEKVLVILNWAVQGDSGGPVIYNGKVVGVICFGVPVKRLYGRYTITPISCSPYSNIAKFVDSYQDVKPAPVIGKYPPLDFSKFK